MKDFGDVYVDVSPIQGNGLFAGRDFEEGEVVVVWHPTPMTQKEYDDSSEHERNYIFLENGTWYRQSEPACYVNFSCEPNSHVINNCDVALKDIAKGEEITSSDDGGEVYYTCTCGSPQCKNKR
jgi:hypothetical protein